MDRTASAESLSPKRPIELLLKTLSSARPAAHERYEGADCLLFREVKSGQDKAEVWIDEATRFPRHLVFVRDGEKTKTWYLVIRIGYHEPALFDPNSAKKMLLFKRFVNEEESFLQRHKHGATQ